MAKKKTKKVVKRNSRGGIDKVSSKEKAATKSQAPKNTTVSKTGGKTRAQLEKELELTTQLAEVVKQKANLEGKDTSGITQEIARSKSGQAQTKAQGSTPYAGSTFEQQFKKENPTYTSPITEPIQTVQEPLTQEQITGAVTDGMGTQEQGYQPDMTSQAQGTQPEQTDGQGNVIPQTASQSGTVVGSQDGQVGVSVPQTNGSIVDYLNASGQASDFGSRARIAESLGIQGYTGTAEQNGQMIASLRGAPISTQESITPVSAGAITATSNTAPNATAQSYTAVQQKFGLPQTPQDFASDPIKTIKDITKQVFSSMGLGEANKEIKNISGELEDLENNRDDEIRDINDDPWLTEGVRLRQIQKVEQKYEDRINNRVNRLQLLESVRDDATQQAQFALGTAISLFDQERRFQATQTQMYYDQAQREFDNSIKMAELMQPKSQGGEGTTDIQEYVFAVERGYKGDFFSWKNPVKGTISAGTGTGTGNGVTTTEPSQYGPVQPEDSFLTLMRSTKGKKLPNQIETLKPIQKSIGVINQLDSLQSSIAQSNTGPVIGFLQGLNPYSFDARAVQAQLQSIVPNLARGVYGEVGVLTDQDIRNYIQTLPNIKSTTQQNDFVTAMTLKTVQRNFENQLETLASAGYDISGFENQYSNIINTVRSVESRLGQAEQTQTQTQQQDFGFIGNALRYLFD